MQLRTTMSALILFGGALCISAVSSGAKIGAAAVFTQDGKLRLPSDYREWMYVSTGLGMSYTESSGDHEPSFDNVFVQRDAYREFTRTQVWPNGTMFVLELRRSSDHGSILKAGRFQSDVVSIEASVKDGRRFANKWAYFDFGPTAKDASPLPDRRCFSCHRQNAAIDNSFIQFYPALVNAIKSPEARPR
jgi:Cytochrome P460